MTIIDRLCSNRTLLTTAIAVGLSACGDSSPVEITDDAIGLAITVPMPNFEGIEATAVRFIVTNSSGGGIVDTTAAVPTSSARAPSSAAPAATSSVSRPGSGSLANQSSADVRFVVRIPGETAGTAVVLNLTILDNGGAVIYEGVEQAIADLGTTTSVLIEEVFYAGPGSEAAEMSLQVEGTFFQVGDVHLVSATIRDGAGTLLTDVPTLWTIDVPSFSVLRAYYTGGQSMVDVMANSTFQPAVITAVLPNGVQASAALQVDQYYPRAILLDVPDLQAETLSLSFEADALLEVDTIIALPHSAEMSIHAFWERMEFPRMRPIVVNASGVQMYRGEQEYLIAGEAPVEMALEYIGPGADAAAVEILPGTPVAVGPGTTLHLEAAAHDESGSVIIHTPIQWSGDAVQVLSVEYNGDGATDAEVQLPFDEGVYEVVASAPNGAADTLQVTVEPIGGQGVAINFDLGDFPDGSPWVSGVVVAEQYASLGAHFDFLPTRSYEDLQGGPTLAKETDATVGSLTVDFIGTPDLRRGKALGYITLRLDTPVPEVRMDFWSPTGDVDFEVRDAQGDLVPSADIVKTGTETPWEVREVIISLPAGIYEVRAFEPGAAYYLDNIRY